MRLRLYHDRLAIVHFVFWVQILGPFSGSKKSRETTMRPEFEFQRMYSSTNTPRFMKKRVDILIIIIIKKVKIFMKGLGFTGIAIISRGRNKCMFLLLIIRRE